MLVYDTINFNLWPLAYQAESPVTKLLRTCDGFTSSSQWAGGAVALMVSAWWVTSLVYRLYLHTFYLSVSMKLVLQDVMVSNRIKDSWFVQAPWRTCRWWTSLQGFTEARIYPDSIFYHTLKTLRLLILTEYISRMVGTEELSKISKLLNSSH